ncbi:MAG TPA: CHRD domain-containing protein [Pyrinomonadaceae bacterium]|nr:CHRD domain-containing protein [Pyrinomonadaceae bacterium]
MNKNFSSLMIVGVFVFIFATTANAENFFAYLEGRQENPAVTTAATGYARVFLNETAGTITYQVVYNNLGSTQTAGHIHTGARGANGPVTIGFAVVGGTSGVINGTSAITAPQIATLRSQAMFTRQIIRAARFVVNLRRNVRLILTVTAKMITAF